MVNWIFKCLQIQLLIQIGTIKEEINFRNNDVNSDTWLYKSTQLHYTGLVFITLLQNQLKDHRLLDSLLNIYFPSREFLFQQ